MKSSFFPVLIQGDEYEDHEVLVRRAFSQRGWDSYNPVGKQYYVFKIADQGIAQVSFKPKVNYDVESVPVEFFGVEYDR
jgi:hypothetical protein